MSNKIKTVRIQLKFRGEGIVGSNGQLNVFDAKKYHVIDIEAAEHKNFTLPLFTVRNGKAHLVDSSRHVVSRIDPDCRQQSLSYLEKLKAEVKHIAAGQMLARPEFLMFGFLYTPGGTNFRRAKPVRITRLVSTTPTLFRSEVVTQRGPKEIADSEDDRKSTSLSYKVSCEEVEMEGEVLINISELQYLPIGQERDRAAIPRESLEAFAAEFERLYGEKLPAPEFYVRSVGSQDVAEEAIIMSDSTAVKLVGVLVEKLQGIEYSLGNGSRRFAGGTAVCRFEDNDTQQVDIKDLPAMLEKYGCAVQYVPGKGLLDKLPHISTEEVKAERKKSGKKERKKDGANTEENGDS